MLDDQEYCARTLSRYGFLVLPVVDDDKRIVGVLPIKRLLVHDPEAHVAAVMSDEPVTFRPSDEASDAAQAFADLP